MCIVSTKVITLINFDMILTNEISIRSKVWNFNLPILLQFFFLCLKGNDHLRSTNKLVFSILYYMIIYFRLICSGTSFGFKLTECNKLPTTMSFTFSVFTYIVAMISDAFLIFFSIFHVSTVMYYRIIS